MRAMTWCAALALPALAGCLGGAADPVPVSTIRLGDGLTIYNDSGVAIGLTGVLLEGAGPPQPRYHGMLSAAIDVTRPTLPLGGKLLRLRFAASGPQFDEYERRLRELVAPVTAKAGDIAKASFTERTVSEGEAPAMPEIERGPGVAEYLVGTGERRRELGPLELHVVKNGSGLGVVTKSKGRTRIAATGFEVEDRGDSVAMYRTGGDVPLLVQRCESFARPCLHPLMAPDLDGVLTEFSPDHHHHQTGVYFGLPDVNGQSYFHRTREGAFVRDLNWRDGNWSSSARGGSKLRWSVTDDWIGDHGPLLTETQRWELTDDGDSYMLDLRWSALAHEELKIAQHEYGGLFVRMPWTPDDGGHAVNSEGQEDAACEGQRARWVDLSVPVPGRKDGKWGHIALLDHPTNPGHPTPYRVDDQFGFGPARSRLGAFTVQSGKTVNARYRLVVYLGDLNKNYVEAAWKEFATTR